MDRAALGRNGIEKVCIGGLTMDVFRYPTPEDFDDLLMSTDGEVLTGIWFAGSRDENKHPLGVVETWHAASLPPVIHDTYRWLDLYFTGRQPDFTPAYRMEGLTPFRKTVLDIVREIPFGRTMTYGEIAKRIVETFSETSPKPRKMSAQAVGGAVVPHRALPSRDGRKRQPYGLRRGHSQQNRFAETGRKPCVNPKSIIFVRQVNVHIKNHGFQLSAISF